MIIHYLMYFIACVPYARPASLHVLQCCSVSTENAITPSIYHCTKMQSLGAGAACFEGLDTEPVARKFGKSANIVENLRFILQSAIWFGYTIKVMLDGY